MRINHQPVWLCDNNVTERDKLSCKFKNIIFTLVTVIVLAFLYLGGFFTTVIEDNFEEFTYPLELPNFPTLIDIIDRYQINNQITELDHESFVSILKNVKVDGLDTQAISPYNQLSDLKFDTDLTQDCSSYWFQSVIEGSDEETQIIRVIVVVKSAVNYHKKRDAIRASWQLNKRIGFFKFRTVFMVGKCHENNPVPKLLRSSNGGDWTPQMCRDYISKEAATYGDIIQSSGIDSYYNNTIKTTMTHKWLTERCQSDFIVTIDDDYALEVENLIEYLQELAMNNYDYELQLNNFTSTSNGSISNNYAEKKLIALGKLSNQYLYAGYLRDLVHPHRHFTSKYYISKQDYPFNKYPQFITGGFILMSQKFSRHFYLASYLVRFFKFDDVYLGIIAFKLGAIATHEENAMCTQDSYIQSEPYKQNSTNCIAVHEVAPQDLETIWTLKRRYQQLSQPMISM